MHITPIQHHDMVHIYLHTILTYLMTYPKPCHQIENSVQSAEKLLWLSYLEIVVDSRDLHTPIGRSHLKMVTYILAV